MRKEGSLNLLAIAHGLWFGGAWIATLEFFEFFKDVLNLKVMLCSSSSTLFTKPLKLMGVDYRAVPCEEKLHFPDMLVSQQDSLVKWADAVWITDVEYLVAPRVKAVKNVPVLAHLHSYSLICPTWTLYRGMKAICLEKCTAGRAIRCAGELGIELAKLGATSSWRGIYPHISSLLKKPSSLDLFRHKQALREAVSCIDGFIAVSSFVKLAHTKLLEVGDKPISVVHNLVTYPMKYAESRNCEKTRADVVDVIYAAGPDPFKGPHLALDSLKALAESGLSVKMKMFGCKDTWVERYARRIGISRSVEFRGKASFAELYSAMQYADVVIVPSLWPEPFGRVPVEANRLGTPAVVTNRGGLPEVVAESVTGYISKPVAENLAEGIRDSLKRKPKREEVVSKSLERVNPRDNARRFLELIYSLA
ncbi:MAG: glycosyltransferase family 4 protein [Desulfurococcaceae archaeon]